MSRNDAVKLYCVERTAKEGGHASCGARDASAGCNGVEKTYSYNGPDIPEGLAEDPRVKKLMDRVQKEQKAFDKEDRKSLVEVTGQAVSASRRGIRNMRASIAGRDEPEQSPAPSNPPPAGFASQEPLPELPGGAAPAVPLSAAEHAERSLRRYAARGERGAAGAQEPRQVNRRTLRCVRSLFRRCGSDADAQRARTDLLISGEPLARKLLGLGDLTCATSRGQARCDARALRGFPASPQG